MPRVMASWWHFRPNETLALPPEYTALSPKKLAVNICSSAHRWHGEGASLHPGFRNAPKDQQQLLQEIQTLDPLIRKLKERIRSSNATGLAKNLETPLIHVKEMMEHLAKKLDLEGVQKFSSRLTWSMWGKDDVQDGLNTIERFKSLLNLWIGGDSCLELLFKARPSYYIDHFGWRKGTTGGP
ncbi:hypothetical protein DFH08DRAFT_810493 [Mycena albidolilacea]|uniref:Uncharacterized protein n=1 Tax=Mycena albidolilacea TaxID=1033008 RepID=A0AAD7EQQ7_9AGAR|nr:hypothetical protein DFH08DRAFT_810493 [Mycena albidolilacea]